ncbi:MAG: 5-formyltetrahydrofolate cyclo-ligase [Spirochaetota bacterium]|nr:5-formyltetrahydrofolate cyclo-ligase [Spirochaetota bacterium]
MVKYSQPCPALRYIFPVMNTRPANDDKKILRALLLQRRMAIPPEIRLAADQAIREHCAALIESLGAQTALGFYWPIKNEPDLLPLARAMRQEGRTIAFPALCGDDMVLRIIEDIEHDLMPARFGIAEPKDHCPALTEIGERLLFIPGLGFDAAGNRLGYGKGYFDRYLARAGGLSAGITYEVCILPHIPSGEKDQPMRWLISEERCLETAAPRQNHAPL